MKLRTSIQRTETDKASMQERWRQGESLNKIALLFDRHHSAIGGILSRTGGVRPRPRRRAARALALSEREEISRGVMAGLSVRTIARALARTVAEKLRLEWSPYQVAGWLKRTYPQDETRQVSHETIYRTLFIQARGALKKELLQHLRRTRGMRRSRHHTQKTPDHGRITETVIDALIKQAHKLPRELYKSLTWDRGSEMAEHQRFSLATDIQVYFCDPQQRWQRGSNENTNGLLRQYFPKGMDLSDISQTKLNAIARRLNERPRQTLGFETPAERFGQCVASIG